MEIHPNNAVVLGCVAMVSADIVIWMLASEIMLTGPGTNTFYSQTLERRKQLDTALSYYNKAIEVSPENALVRYRRAKMMVSMRKYNVSLVLLPIYAPKAGGIFVTRLTD
jgi:anaphase-promoting complex subunit 3